MSVLCQIVHAQLYHHGLRLRRVSNMRSKEVDDLAKVLGIS